MLSLYTKTMPKAFKVSFSKVLKELLFPYKMDKVEAMKILDLNDNFSQRDLELKYHNFYNNNSINNKGSPYIQTIIKNAHDFLLHNSSAI